MMIYVLDRVENIVGEGENAGYQHSITETCTRIHIKVPIAPTRKVFVYKIKVNLIHTILKYGNYYDFMDR